MKAHMTKMKTLEMAVSRVFYSVFGRVAYALGWLLLLFIPVQPFADEVANHTCRNRDNKSDEKISHMTTLLPVPI